MKHTILVFALLSAGITSHAQVSSGKVTYDETISFAIDLPEEAIQFKDMFPKEAHVTRILFFNEEAALFRAEKKDEKPAGVTAEDGGMQLQIKIQTPDEIVYTNLKTGTTTEQRDFMGRKFLIAGDGAKKAWKMTGKQKTILSYPCQEAIAMSEKDTITAWFTTAIPVSAGPQGWRGLPGLVLEASNTVPNGAYTIKAVKVDEGLTDASVIAAPKEGKKVTKKEFDAIAEAKRKEMQEQYGGKGNVIIRMEEN